MRVILLLIPVFICLVIIARADSLLTRPLKSAIRAINAETAATAGIKVITWLHCLVLGLLLWIPPLTTLPGALLLEYRIGITMFYWLLVIITCHWYLLSRKIPGKLAITALSTIVASGLAMGVFIVPILVLLQDTLNN